MSNVKIRKSVGYKGKNESEDTKKIQNLLNGHAGTGGFGKLNVDGIVGPKTIGAIKGFQKRVMGGKADGRVDKNKKTIIALNEKPGSGGGVGDKKAEQEANKALQKLAKNLSVLPKKEKSDLDKANKLIKVFEQEAKIAKTKGKDKHAIARAEILTIWEKLKKHRKDAMSKVAEITEVCKTPAPSGATFDKYKSLQRSSHLTMEPMMDWVRQINELERTAKGLDPKSPLAKGVKESIKRQRSLWEDVQKTTSKNINKTVEFLVTLKSNRC